MVGLADVTNYSYLSFDCCAPVDGWPRLDPKQVNAQWNGGGTFSYSLYYALVFHVKMQAEARGNAGCRMVSSALCEGYDDVGCRLWKLFGSKDYLMVRTAVMDS